MRSDVTEGNRLQLSYRVAVVVLDVDFTFCSFEERSLTTRALRLRAAVENQVRARLTAVSALPYMAA